jgi:hypothetical protein
MRHTHKNHKALLHIVFGGLALAIGGCDIDETSLMEDEVDPASAADPAEDAEEAENFRIWTGFTSEEYPPLYCPTSNAVRGFDCSGSYCDNVSLYCDYTYRSTIGYSYWTGYFSEEGDGSADEGRCNGPQEWMTALDCNGSYCDNIDIQCSQFPGSSTGNCYWTGWYSEEQSSFLAPSGHFFKGIECGGDYCDNKRYLYCRKH